MGLFSSYYFSAVHQGLVYTHVLGALLSLVVAPIAMIVHKGGQAHRRWGKLYFWGMFVTNGTAFVVHTCRCSCGTGFFSGCSCFKTIGRVQLFAVALEGCKTSI